MRKCENRTGGKKRTAASRLLDLVYPPKCILCHELLSPGEADLCQRCLKTIPVTDTRHGKNYGLYFDVCLSPLHYEGYLRDSFHRYKFGGQWQYGRIYARWMLQCLNQRSPLWRTHFDYVTWIPLHPARLRKRGYDQSKLLARHVARGLHLRFISTLRKCGNVTSQSQIETAEKRWENIEGAFVIRSRAPVEGKRILLVDDLYTTGATMEEASKMLRTAGAEEVCGLTLACGARKNTTKAAGADTFSAPFAAIGAGLQSLR